MHPLLSTRFPPWCLAPLTQPCVWPPEKLTHQKKRFSSFRLRQTLTTGLQTAQTTGERLSTLKSQKKKICHLGNPSVTRLSPTKGASASASSEEKVKEKINLFPKKSGNSCQFRQKLFTLHCSVAGNLFTQPNQCQSVAMSRYNIIHATQTTHMTERSQTRWSRLNQFCVKAFPTNGSRSESVVSNIKRT